MIACYCRRDRSVSVSGDDVIANDFGEGVDVVKVREGSDDCQMVKESGQDKKIAKEFLASGRRSG